MNRFDTELAEVNQPTSANQAAARRLGGRDAGTPQGVERGAAQNNVPLADRQKILAGEQKKWEDQRKTARKKIAALDRKNAARFNDVAGRMFTRLAHEAFHAYLETHVYPRQTFDVPRWLNEGLAQIFEAGLLESDSLRIDTPNWIALSQLQNDLRSSRPLELAELLSAGSDTFLSAHTADSEAASRFYYYSWGLAYYLAFEPGILGSSQFEAYLSPAAAKLPPVARFEKLVGMPLTEFQARWTAYRCSSLKRPAATPAAPAATR